MGKGHRGVLGVWITLPAILIMFLVLYQLPGSPGQDGFKSERITAQGVLAEDEHPAYCPQGHLKALHGFALRVSFAVPCGAVPTGRDGTPSHQLVHSSATPLDAGSLERPGPTMVVWSVGILLATAVNAVLFAYSTKRSRKLQRDHISLVASVSHELRTPVTAIRMMAENLADGIPVTLNQTRQYGELLRQEGTRLEAMVEHILRCADTQRQALRYEAMPIDVNEAIQTAMTGFRTIIDASGLVVGIRVQPDLPQVSGNSSALGQCLENLLSNALKYGDGPIMITADLRSQGSSAEEVIVTVTDKGPGIPFSEQPRIFRAFYRGHTARESSIPGNGLGLCLVKQMTEEMGGRVTFHSDPGSGSAFSLHLRRANREDPRTTRGGRTGNLSATPRSSESGRVRCRNHFRWPAWLRGGAS